MSNHQYLIPLHSEIDWDYCPEIAAVQYTQEDVERWLEYAKYLVHCDAHFIALNESIEAVFWGIAERKNAPAIVINEENYWQQELPFRHYGGRVSVFQNMVQCTWYCQDGTNAQAWLILLEFNKDGSSIEYRGEKIDQSPQLAEAAG